MEDMQTGFERQCIPNATSCISPVSTVLVQVAVDGGSEDELNALLAEAAAAPPGSRIEYRDAIARYGRLAIDRIEPWLTDERLGAFAVRVAERAASYDARAEAVRALQRAVEQAVS
jgi:hypothetical protein